MAEAFDPDKYLKEKTAAPQSQAFDPDKYLQEKGLGQAQPQQMGPPSKLQAILANTPVEGTQYGVAGDLEKMAQRLDYPGGIIRTALAAGAGLASGQTPVASEEAKAIALGKQQAPSSSEYMNRLGVPEGPTKEAGLLPRISARDVAGFGSDIATDPLSYVSMAGKPLGALTEAAGEGMYRSGLKKVDERLAETKSGKLADILMDEGKWGTTKSLQKDSQEIASKLSEKRGLLYDKATQAGAKVDMTTALGGAEKQISNLRSDPGLAPIADKLEDMINRYKAAGPVDLKTASQWKTNLYDALPESAYAQHGKLKGPAKDFQKALARDFKESIVDSAEKVEPGLGQGINDINKKLATIISSKKPMAMQARRAETPNLVSSIDAMIGGYGLHDPGTAAAILAAKKGVDLSKTTLFRTGGGLGLQNLGKSGLLDVALQRELINKNK